MCVSTVNPTTQNPSGTYSGTLGDRAVCIGQGPSSTLGSGAIQIGKGGTTSHGSGSICICSSTGSVGATSALRASGFFVSPIFGVDNTYILKYNISTAEITYVASNLRSKRDVKNFIFDTSLLYELNPRTFIYKNDESNVIRIGYISDEVSAIFYNFATYEDDGQCGAINWDVITLFTVEELKKTRLKIIDITSNISDIRSNISEIRSDLSKVNSNVITNLAAIGTINSNVVTNSISIGTVNSNVITNSAAIGTVNSNVTQLRSDLSTLKSNVSDILSNTNTRIASLNSNISEIRSNLVNLTSNVTQNRVDTDTRITEINTTIDERLTYDIPHPRYIGTSKRLIHSPLYGPRCDLVYRNTVTLTNGIAFVNVDQMCTANSNCAMTEGTFQAISKNPQVFLQNTTSFDSVLGTISGNLLKIRCSNTASTDTISWMVVAERNDSGVHDWSRVDPTASLITEYDGQ